MELPGFDTNETIDNCNTWNGNEYKDYVEGNPQAEVLG
jgi:hypothetical protein